nr:glutathione S-transferase T3-like [Tanacetum cinerariifolium]
HTLNANCQKFNATYKRANRLGRSGENDVDVLKRAQSIYRDEHKGVTFCQQDAWAILKFHLKWDAPEQVDLTGDELRFLATSTKDLDDVDAYWIKKQKRLIRNKLKNDLGAEDDEDE